jgi:protein-disulfide isomerase
MPDDGLELSEETDKSSGDSVINYVIVAVLFTVAGAMLAMLFLNNGISENSVRDIVSEMSVDEEELREIVGDLVIDEAELQIIIQAVLQETGAGADSVLVDRPTPVPAAPVANDELVDDDPYFGPEDAPIVIVEFSDFLCPYCSRHSLETMPTIGENYPDLVRYVFRDFHGIGGDRSVQAAIAAECADDQGKYWEYHAMLFNNQSSVSAGDMDALRTLLITYANVLELDLTAFTTCLEDQVYLNDVNDDHFAAQRGGVSGVPTFFINGTMFVGAQPYQNFADFIDSELRRLGY